GRKAVRGDPGDAEELLAASDPAPRSQGARRRVPHPPAGARDGRTALASILTVAVPQDRFEADDAIPDETDGARCGTDRAASSAVGSCPGCLVRPHPDR